MLDHPLTSKSKQLVNFYGKRYRPLSVINGQSCSSSVCAGWKHPTLKPRLEVNVLGTLEVSDYTQVSDLTLRLPQEV